MPNQRRRCMGLWCDERAYEEIATLLQLPVGTVKAHLWQGKQQLKRIVAEMDGRQGHEP